MISNSIICLRKLELLLCVITYSSLSNALVRNEGNLHKLFQFILFMPKFSRLTTSSTKLASSHAEMGKVPEWALYHWCVEDMCRNVWVCAERGRDAIFTPGINVVPKFCNKKFASWKSSVWKFSRTQILLYGYFSVRNHHHTEFSP